MKRLKTLTVALLLFSALAVQGAGTKQGPGLPALDKAGLEAQLSELLQSAAPKGIKLSGDLDLIVRVKRTGKLEVLDISGKQQTVVVARIVLANAALNVDESMEGRAFRLSFEYGEPLS